jgi:hypothetical protein
MPASACKVAIPACYVTVHLCDIICRASVKGRNIRLIVQGTYACKYAAYVNVHACHTWSQHTHTHHAYMYIIIFTAYMHALSTTATIRAVGPGSIGIGKNGVGIHMHAHGMPTDRLGQGKAEPT